MDALTHALIMAILLQVAGIPEFIPFAVLGAVIIDADILFGLVSDRSPDLYIFTHGGVAHSVAGATVIAVLAFAGAALAAAAGAVEPVVIAQPGILGFSFILFGAFIHLGLDALACPGIPLLYPVIEKKYTPRILPGPSVFLMGVSIAFVGFMAIGGLSLARIAYLYLSVLVVFLSFKAAVFLYANATCRGSRTLLPLINPFRWLVIYETDDAYVVKHYMLFRGISGSEVFEKYKNTIAGEVEPYLALPEIKRLKFYSYIVMAEKDNSSLIFCDPLRVRGYVFYPPDFKRVSVSMDHDSGKTPPR